MSRLLLLGAGIADAVAGGGASAAMTLLDGENDGLAFDFTDTVAASGSAAVKDTGTPANDFDGAPQDLLTYSGSSAKWVWNNAGTLIESAAGTLPIDHAPLTPFARRGLLVEKMRESLLLHTQALDNAAWNLLSGGTGSDPVVTANAGTAPDGTSTADRIQLDKGAGTTTTDQSLIYQIGTLASTAHTRSVFMKSFDGTSYDVALRNGQTGNFEVKTVTSDWQRFSHTESSANPQLQIILRGTYGTDDTADILVWQAEVAYNSVTGEFISSIIPTTTATVTRNADTPLLATSILPWSNSAGTVYIKGRTAAGAGLQVIWQADDGTADERIRVVRNGSRELRCIVTDGGVGMANLNLGTVADDTEFQVTFGWAAGDFAGSLDGGSVVTHASGTIPVVTTVQLGHSHAGEQHDAPLAKSVWVPSKITNANIPTWRYTA